MDNRLLTRPKNGSSLTAVGYHLQYLTSKIELHTIDSAQTAALHHEFFIMTAGAEIPKKDWRVQR
jgi:hypothetical protein